MMHIAVVGATGVLGRNVVPRLLERGHGVRALARRADQAESLRRIGVTPIPGDIFDTDALAEATRGCDAALHLATAIPKDGVDWSLNDRIRREGTRNVLAAAARNGARRYVQQSIAMLYRTRGDSLADETSAVDPSERGQSAADMETMVRAADRDWCILRGGLFYGPGTGLDEGWRQLARAGDLRLPPDPEDRISLVHVADMARAVVLAVEAAPARSLYNVVDDEPVTYRTLYGYIAARENGAEPPPGGTAFLPSFASTNAKIKAEMSWQPAYPTFRSGLV